eukprot:Rmarinus@m.14285
MLVFLEPCFKNILMELFPTPTLPTRIGTYCCAEFFVTRKSIHHSPLHTYRAAMSMVDGTRDPLCPEPPERGHNAGNAKFAEGRRRTEAISIERLWHVFFQPYFSLRIRSAEEELEMALWYHRQFYEKKRGLYRKRSTTDVWSRFTAG